MARIRTIKPGFWKHEELSNLAEGTHMLAAALLNYVDDEGYFNANHKLIKAELFPLREPSVSVHDSLRALSSVGYLRLGTCVDGRRYGQIVKFCDHQIINRPTPSKIREMSIVWDNSHITHTQLTEGSPPEGNKEGNKEGKGKGTGKALTRVGEDAFAAWYDGYPRKAGRKTAAKAFASALLETNLATLIAGRDRYSAEVAGKEQAHIKHPATWLNGECWTDEPGANSGATNGHAKPKRGGTAEIRDGIARAFDERYGEGGGCADPGQPETAGD